MRFSWTAQLFSLACLLCGLPVLLSTYPPMVDVPQHAAQIMSLKAMLFGDNWAFSDLFEIKPFTPYWLGYGIAMALSVPFGIVLAVKLLVAGSLSLFTWAAARFCIRMGMPSAWAWMLLVLPYGVAFQWGFLNFVVAAPLGFLFLTTLLDLGGRRDWRAVLRIAAWLHCLFFAHILVAGFFCAAALLLLAAPWAGWRAWLQRCLPVFTIAPLGMLWLAGSLLNTPSASDPIVWNIDARRIVDFLPMLVSAPDAMTGQIIGAIFLLAPFLSGARPKEYWTAYLPFALYVAWMLFIPHYIAGSFFNYERFGIFGIPFYLLCFEKKPDTQKKIRSVVAPLGMALIAIAMIGWHSARAMVFNTEVTGYQAVIEKAAPEKKILMLDFDLSSKASYAPLMLHMAGWYQAEHRGLAEFNFAHFWISPLQYKKHALAEFSQDFEWYPQSLDWHRHQGDSFQYVLMRRKLNGESWLKERSAANVAPIAINGEWQLYEVLSKN